MRTRERVWKWLQYGCYGITLFGDNKMHTTELSTIKTRKKARNNQDEINRRLQMELEKMRQAQERIMSQLDMQADLEWLLADDHT